MMKAFKAAGILYLLFLIFFAQDGWTVNWTSYATSHQGDLSYDESSINKINPHTIHVCTKKTFHDHQKQEIYFMLQRLGKAPEHPQMLSHALVLYEIDCINRNIQDFCTIIYSQNGSVIYLSTQSEAKDSPDSSVHDTDNKLKNIACRGYHAAINPATASPGNALIAIGSKKDPSSVQRSDDKDQSVSFSEKVVRELITKWLDSWQAGDMDNYRSCYAPDFTSKGKNLDAWIRYKTGIRQISEDIHIRITQLRISFNGDQAKAVFLQDYQSSTYKDSGQKTLHLKKINDEWKIYRELM